MSSQLTIYAMIRRCKTTGCKNPAVKHRSMCSKCRTEAWKRRNPMRHAFNMHRKNARRRGISWDLSYEAFTALWHQHPDKWEAKRRSLTGESDLKCFWEIDRIDPALGYIEGNVRIIHKAVNIALRWDQHGRKDFDITVTRVLGDTDWEALGVPF